MSPDPSVAFLNIKFSLSSFSIFSLKPLISFWVNSFWFSNSRIFDCCLSSVLFLDESLTHFSLSFVFSYSSLTHLATISFFCCSARECFFCKSWNLLLFCFKFSSMRLMLTSYSSNAFSRLCCYLCDSSSLSSKFITCCLRIKASLSIKFGSDWHFCYNNSFNYWLIYIYSMYFYSITPKSF